MGWHGQPSCFQFQGPYTGFPCEDFGWQRMCFPMPQFDFLALGNDRRMDFNGAPPPHRANEFEAIDKMGRSIESVIF